jgi:hypothetical protein
VRLAAVCESIVKTLGDPTHERPALLVSYAYIKQFDKNRRREPMYWRDWSMDSGAFSASTQGKHIRLADYIFECRTRLAQDPRLTEVFSLDVIGDWQASEANTRKMWAAGVEAIPTFHVGEPWDVLRGLVRDYPKIGIGGCVGMAAEPKFAWVSEVFAIAWPAKIHGLGMIAESLVLGFPFHSVDASSWDGQARRYGQWAAFDGITLPGYGNIENLWAEVKLYLDLEERARVRWVKEMEELGDN